MLGILLNHRLGNGEYAQYAAKLSCHCLPGRLSLRANQRWHVQSNRLAGNGKQNRQVRVFNDSVSSSA